jgi:hypothetical protein
MRACCLWMQRSSPRRIWRNAVRMLEDGERIAQCWFGVEKDGRVRFKLGNNAGLGVMSWPDDVGFEEGW